MSFHHLPFAGSCEDRGIRYFVPSLVLGRCPGFLDAQNKSAGEARPETAPLLGRGMPKLLREAAGGDSPGDVGGKESVSASTLSRWQESPGRGTGRGMARWR